MNTLECSVLENPPIADIELYLGTPEQDFTAVKKVKAKSSFDEVPEINSPAAAALNFAGQSGTPFLKQFEG